MVWCNNALQGAPRTGKQTCASDVGDSGHVPYFRVIRMCVFTYDQLLCGYRYVDIERHHWPTVTTDGQRWYVQFTLHAVL